jgi:hypothetical protein
MGRNDFSALLKTHVEIKGQLIPKTDPRAKVHLQKIKKKELSETAPPALHPGLEKLPEKDQDIIKEIYSKSTAALVIYTHVQSTNKLRWKHWIHKHRDRQDKADMLDNSLWKIPMGNTIPQPLTTRRPRRIAFIRYGGRRQDRINYADGCKGLLDELVKRNYLIDDTEQWVNDSYHQIPGGPKRLEILFVDEPPQKT